MRMRKSQFASVLLRKLSTDSMLRLLDMVKRRPDLKAKVALMIKKVRLSDPKVAVRAPVVRTDWMTPLLSKATREGARERGSDMNYVSKRIIDKLRENIRDKRELRWAWVTCQRLVAATLDALGQAATKSRLKSIKALAVVGKDGQPCQVNRRLVLKTTPWPTTEDEFCVRAVCLGEIFWLSLAECRESDIPVEAPCLMSYREVLELKMIKRVNRWAARVGRINKKFMSRRDMREEEMVGPRPQTKSEAKKKMADFVQNREPTKGNREVWRHMMLRETSDRQIFVPTFSSKVVEREVLVALPDGKHEKRTERFFESTEVLDEFNRSVMEVRATGRDPEDPDTELNLGDFRKDFYSDATGELVPLNKRSQAENVLWKRWAYRTERTDVIHLSRLCKDGMYERLPKQKFGEHGWYFHKEHQETLRSSFEPGDLDKDGKPVVIAFWDKRYAESSAIKIMEPSPLFPEFLVDSVTDNEEVARIVKDPALRPSAYLTSWKGGHMVFRKTEKIPEGSWTMSQPDGVSELAREVDGMLMAAIEERAADHMVLEKAEHWWDEVSYQGPHELNPEGKIVLLGEYKFERQSLVQVCFRCQKDRKDNSKHKFTKMEHAFVCPICGNEVPRITGRVWVSLDVLKMLPIKERMYDAYVSYEGPHETKDGPSLEGIYECAATHVEFPIYGAWLGQLIKDKAPIGRKFKVIYPEENGGVLKAPPAGDVSQQRNKKFEITEWRNPSWVSDLLNTASKDRLQFLEMFKASVIKRYETQDREATEIVRLKGLAIAQREFFVKVYGPECLTPLLEGEELVTQDIAF